MACPRSSLFGVYVTPRSEVTRAVVTVTIDPEYVGGVVPGLLRIYVDDSGIPAVGDADVGRQKPKGNGLGGSILFFAYSISWQAWPI